MLDYFINEHVTTFKVEHGFCAKLFVRQYGSIIVTIGASKDFRSAVPNCSIVRFLKERSIPVELSNREAKLETGQFDGIG